MVKYRVVFTKRAQKDAKKIKRAGLKKKVEQLIKIVQKHPYQNPPVYEKLIGDLEGAYSRRINLQHRFVYQVIEEVRVVKVLAMWTHYE